MCARLFFWFVCFVVRAKCARVCCVRLYLPLYELVSEGMYCSFLCVKWHRQRFINTFSIPSLQQLKGHVRDQLTILSARLPMVQEAEIQVRVRAVYFCHSGYFFLFL